MYSVQPPTFQLPLAVSQERCHSEDCLNDGGPVRERGSLLTMQITLDGAPYVPAWNLDGEISILEVVRRVGDEILAGSRLLVTIRVDGVTTQDTEDPALAAARVESVENLELISEPVGKVAIRVLYEAARQIPDLCTALTQIAEKIQSRRVPEAMNLLADCVSTWEELHKGILHASATVGVTFAEVVVEGRTGEDIAGDLLKVIEEASGMLVAEEYNDLADLLSYEAEPRLRDMQEAVYKVISTAEQARH